MNQISNFQNKIRNSLAGKRTPTELILFVTERCNARCRHCFIKDLNNPLQPELVNIEKIIKSLKEPLNTLVLTGGEPFLRADLKDIIEKFDTFNKPHTVIICTNGILTDKIFETVKITAEKYKSINFKIQISLDGLKETHEKIRNVPGVFDKAVNTIKKLKELKARNSNIDIIVLTVISNININEIEKLNEFVEKNLKVVHDFELIRGSSFFNIPQSISLDSNPADDSYICPSIEALENTKNIMDSIYKKNCTNSYSKLKAPLAYAYKTVKHEFILNLVKKGKPVKTCGAGREWGVIYANYDVGLCEMLKTVGNLEDHDFDFEKVWRGTEANRLRESMKCYCTHGCFLDNTMFNTKSSYLKMLKKAMGYYI